MNPFDKNYRGQLANAAPEPKGSTRAGRLKQALRREEKGSAFDRHPLRLSEPDADKAKTARIKTAGKAGA